MRATQVACLIVVLALSACRSAHAAEDLPRHKHPGYYTVRSVWGYQPYAPFVGPIRARYALDPYVYSPRQPGVDYSWGIDYFFGQGPGDRTYQGAPRK